MSSYYYLVTVSTYMLDGSNETARDITFKSKPFGAEDLEDDCQLDAFSEAYKAFKAAVDDRLTADWKLARYGITNHTKVRHCIQMCVDDAQNRDEGENYPYSEVCKVLKNVVIN